MLQKIVFSKLNTGEPAKVFFSKKLASRTIAYNNTDLIKPSKHHLLLKELKEITELNITRFQIGKVDYIKNHAQIKIYFTDPGNTNYNDEESTDDND